MSVAVEYPGSQSRRSTRPCGEYSPGLVITSTPAANRINHQRYRHCNSCRYECLRPGHRKLSSAPISPFRFRQSIALYGNLADRRKSPCSIRLIPLSRAFALTAASLRPIRLPILSTVIVPAHCRSIRISARHHVFHPLTAAVLWWR